VGPDIIERSGSECAKTRAERSNLPFRKIKMKEEMAHITRRCARWRRTLLFSHIARARGRKKLAMMIAQAFLYKRESSFTLLVLTGILRNRGGPDDRKWYISP